MPPRPPIVRPLLVLLAVALPCMAADPPSEPPAKIEIRRAQGAITIDADLSDPGWQGAPVVDTFYETNPGDNIPPRVRNVARLAYDDHYFYAALELEDPDPSSIRAPFGDRDAVPGYTDYAGVILDTRNDAKSAVLLLVNPHNIQYDAKTNDASGEDPSLDLYWDSAARITATGWVIEMRVPFSSLRYTPADPQTWGILLYRNWPREFRTQMFSAKLPRGSSCFICHRNDLVGLADLPSGSHLVAAPYVTGRQSKLPEDGVGTPLDRTESEWEGGIDAKWTVNADTAIDATINPDFSQVESDVAQIGINERFALFFPERRPFFLEGLDLFQTPIQAVYTRTITSPSWGARATGEAFGSAYTLLVTDDRGGGSVILPGAESSGLAPQDFESTVVIGRARKDFGDSFGSFVLTGRQIDEGDGGGHNWVAGPDFRWRPNSRDQWIGQLLLSDTEDPDRPDLTPEWQGEASRSHALYLSWNRNTPTYDVFFEGRDIGDEFQADAGFVPQVGIREGIFEAGRTYYREEGPLRSWRPFLRGRQTVDRDGELVFQRFFPAIDIRATRNSNISTGYNWDKVRSDGKVFSIRQFFWESSLNPSRTFAQLVFNGHFGEDVDLANGRPARGGSVTLNAILKPTDHLDVRLNSNRQWLDVRDERPDAGGERGRLFTADVVRLRVVYTFTSRMFLRLIGQQTRTERDPLLYTFLVRPEDEAFSGSALFAYKLNWQTVLFLGFGDERTLDPLGSLEPARRELFFKLSYAFQR